MGQKAAFLNLKLCHSISQPPLRIAFCGWRKILLCMTDFGLKTAFLTVKGCQAISKSPFGVGTSSLDIMCFSVLEVHTTLLGSRARNGEASAFFNFVTKRIIFGSGFNLLMIYFGF